MWSRRLDQRKRWRSISYILLEWIIQSLSHAAVNHPPKGGLLQCAQEHSDPRGAGYLSTPTDQSVPANGFTPSPSTFHSCMCVRVCVVCVWGRASLCPWTMVALEVAQSLPRVHLTPPPFALNPSAAFSSSLLPTLSLPSSCNYITCTMSF